MALRSVERLLLGYLALSSMIGLNRIAAQPAIAWVLADNLLIAALVFLVAQPGQGPVGRIIRDLYPLIMLGALYPALDILNNFGGIRVHDATVLGWEATLFGRELSRTWWQAQPSRFLSFVLHAAYFAYYLIIFTPPALFLAMGRAEAARRAVLWSMSTLLLCYLVFLLFPVAGPYYEFPRPEPWFLDNPAARLVYSTLESGSAYGAAFPSSHVAATVVALAATFRGSTRMGWVLILPAALLTIGVVYCQMHYAMDALAGLLLGLALVAGWLFREGKRGRAAFREA